MTRRTVAAALAVGLVLRLVFLWRLSHVMGDSLVYGDIARNLLQHGVYGFTQVIGGQVASPRPTLIRLPGYPLFLAGIFRVFGVDRYVPVMVVQLLLDLWTCLLLGGIARRLYGSRAGAAAVWLAALCPFTANFVAAPLTETPTLFCIGAAFYALARWRDEEGWWLYGIAAALGWGLLLRPEQGMLAAAVVPCVGWIAWSAARDRGGSTQVSEARPGAPGLVAGRVEHRTLSGEAGKDGAPGSVRWMRPVVVVSLLTLLPLVPWAGRNWRTFHVFQPLAPRFANDPGETTPFGFQRWYRTWAVDFSSTDLVYWNYDGVMLSVGDLPNRAFDSQAQYEETARLIDDYNQNQATTPAFDARWDALGRARIKADPLRYYVEMPVGRVLNMAFRPRTEMIGVPLEWWHFRGGHPWAALFAWGYGALNLGYFLLAGWGLWRGPRGVIVWGMVALVAMRVGLLLTIDNSEMRYTLEFFPVLIVLGAGAIGGQTAGPDPTITLAAPG